jgi:anthranilate phosphoribosyltransferase
VGITFNPSDSAIVRGIKTVGVGKKGSKSLSQELAKEILSDLKAGKVPDAAKGAFFAGLSFKGIELEEIVLDQYFEREATLLNPNLLARSLCKDAPELIQWICEQVMMQNTLDKETAYALGCFLLSDGPADAARGLIASALRVRYETDDEYEGILKAIQQTIVPGFLSPAAKGSSIVQLAEPFDGNDKSYMITPLIGRYLMGLNYRVVHLVGRNSGPKFELNLLDVAELLKVPFMKNASDLGQVQSQFGWFLRQKELSPAVDRWVDIRRQTVKRPFMATLEKFLNPFHAQVIATSAFHPPYGEKMLTISERAGFPGIIVIRNGIEGSLAFSLKRETRILCSAIQKDGTYLRHEIVFQPEKFLVESVDVEEKMDHPKAVDNARLIEDYRRTGKTENKHFDLRIKATCEGFRMAMEWIGQNVRATMDEGRRTRND